MTAECVVCGPLPPDKDGRVILHDRCHDQTHAINLGGHEVEYVSIGCGHSLDKHTNGMKCQVCKRDCGHTDQLVGDIKEQFDQAEERGTLFA